MYRKLNYFLLAGLFALFACQAQKNIEKLRVEGVNEAHILLNGTWKFNMDPPEEFWLNDVEFDSWNDIEVPGEAQMQGFAIQHDQAFVYKTEFFVPQDFEGKHIQLEFYGVYSEARVWVNGKFIRSHSGGFTKWSCDISSEVKPGEKALLTVEVSDPIDDISYGSGYAKHQIGGILRDVKLLALPHQHFKSLVFETELDENYQNAQLKVFCELTRETMAEVDVKVYDANMKLVAEARNTAKSHVRDLNIPVEKPLLWDAEHPNLYTVVSTIREDEREILINSQKIGFREVKVDGNRLLVNGKPVKLRGACRHDIHPTLGRMTTPEYDLEDVLLAKESNMNFIRTSHYPPSEYFLEMCDKYGIYVEDETAVCFVGSHRTFAYQESGASENDPAYTGRYLSQLKEMVDNHRNHPSVVIWSIGNENHFGQNFVESYKWVKANDPTRPVIYSYPGNVPADIELYDVISMHYPDWQGNLNQRGIETKGFASPEKPMLFDEWAHVACYNNFELKEDPNVRSFWGQSLDSMWTYTFEADGALGGAIWCMLDETFMLPENLDGFGKWWGIVDAKVIPAFYMGPTVGYGEWGIVDTWRRKKPEFFETKKAYSPTKIYIREIENFVSGESLEIPVHNRFDHTNFSELTINWSYGDKSGMLKNVDLAPHKKGVLEIPAIDWKAGEKLKLQFIQNDDLLVDEYALTLAGKASELPVLKSGTLKVAEEQNIVSVSGNHFQLELNKSTGLLQNLVVKGTTLLESGPYLNLRIPGNSIQYSTVEMDDHAKTWECKSFDFSVNDGIVSVHTKGQYDGKVDFEFTARIDSEGLCSINYSAGGFATDKNVQEAGLKFYTGNAFETLNWERRGYFSHYPEGHLSANSGSASLAKGPEMKYRQLPEHNWEMDTKGFYYFGLEPELPYTNIVRGTKENIEKYSLENREAKLTVFSEATQAGRFDKPASHNTLIVNDKWDYNSLLWGNYSKRIKLDGKISGSVLLKAEAID